MQPDQRKKEVERLVMRREFTGDRFHPERIVSAAPGWRVVIESKEPDDDGDMTTMSMPIAGWLSTPWGGLEPLVFEAHAHLIPASKLSGCRVTAIIPAGAEEPLTEDSHSVWTGADGAIQEQGEKRLQ